MRRYLRRGLIGFAAGLFGGVALAATTTGGNAINKPLNLALTFLLGGVVGVGFSIAFRPLGGGALNEVLLDSVMAAAGMSVPLWALLNVVLFPILAGSGAKWTADAMRSLIPELVGWLLYGAALGLLTEILSALSLSWLGPEPAPPATERIEPQRIVILGGGFAGMAAAEALERLSEAAPPIEIVLVSNNNALLFTPMLAEVAGSGLEPTHISSPLRTSLRLTRVIRGEVTTIDLARKAVRVGVPIAASLGEPREAGGDDTIELHYDHLVLALGAVSNYLGIQNLAIHSFDFKTLLDAIRIRNHVIDMFEYADREASPERRRELMTFVVAGGGFAGVELAGSLNDFGRGILPDYPNLSPKDLRIVLVHSRDRILPELSPTLGAYALDRMAARGVEFALGKRLADAGPGTVVLNSGEVIRAQTLVWTAGTAPNPLMKLLPLELDKRGAIVVDVNLAVAGHDGLWALGDCATVIDGKTGKICPPTAQFALREGRAVARNIRAAIDGQPLRPFHFDSLGALCVVGHHTACAELAVPFTGRMVRFSGFLAWIVWRAIYLSKLPGRERKVRVLVDWIIELFFPRDIVQTIDVGKRDAQIAAGPKGSRLL